MRANLILIGGGGHCKAVIDVIEAGDHFNIIGIVDRKEMIGNSVLGYKIIACDDDLDMLIKTYRNFHITIGHTKINNSRTDLFNFVRLKGGSFPTIISPKAYISKHAQVNEGTVVMHKALVNANARIGSNCIINTCAVIEHDVIVENDCHISTGSFVNGGCKIGENSFLGSNSTIIHGVSVAENNVIAAGAVVLKNTESNYMYAGNPACMKKRII